MNAGETKKSARHTPIYLMAGAILAVFLVLVTGAFVGGAGQLRGATPDQGNAHLSPFVIPNTVIYLNRSQSAGTYISEYVSLNNSTTLTKLPATLTVVAATCRWVTVMNTTASANPNTIFHNVQYRNVTATNATGTVLAHGTTTSFKICGAAQAWVNYIYWSYSVYRFSAPTLGQNATMTVGAFASWPGTSTGPANVTATIGPKTTAQFLISTNLTTFTAVLPKSATGATTCDVTGQICSYPTWSFVSAADLANTSTSNTIVFSTASGLRVSAAYENWTVGYKETNVSANTQLGGFFASTGADFQSVIVTWWWAILFVLLILIIVAYAMKDRR